MKTNSFVLLIMLLCWGSAGIAQSGIFIIHDAQKAYENETRITLRGSLILCVLQQKKAGPLIRKHVLKMIRPLHQAGRNP